MHTFVKTTLRSIIGVCQSFISKLFPKKRLSEQYSSKILSWQRHFIGGNGFNSSVSLGWGRRFTGGRKIISIKLTIFQEEQLITSDHKVLLQLRFATTFLWGRGDWGMPCKELGLYFLVSWIAFLKYCSILSSVRYWLKWMRLKSETPVRKL